MDDKRQNLRRHIRAAKDWLGEAEDNLAAKNDIRGDLNLMLAQAELKKVAESKKRSSLEKFAGQLAPLAVAASLAAIVAMPPTDSPIQEYKESVSVPVHEEQSPKFKTEQTIAEIMPAEKTLPKIFSGSERAMDYTAVSDGVPSEEKYIPPEEFVEYDISYEKLEQETHTEPPEVVLPDTEMQKLMQSAGKVLRSE